MHNRFRRGYWRHLPPWWHPNYDVPPIPEPPYGDSPRPIYLGPGLTKDDELRLLEEEEMALMDELDDVQKRIKKLKKELKKEVK